MLKNKVDIGRRKALLSGAATIVLSAFPDLDAAAADALAAARGGSPTIADLGWFGGNLEELKSYWPHNLWSDVVKGASVLSDYTTNAVLSTAAGTLSAAGNPLVDFRCGLSSQNANCPVGSGYTGTITGRTGVPVVQAHDGMTIDSQTNTTGYTVRFSCTMTGATGNATIKFARCGGCVDGSFHIYRPGLDAKSPAFNPQAIAYYKQFGVIRMMKPMAAEANVVPLNWTGSIASGGRATNANWIIGTGGEHGSPMLGMIWEDLIDFGNALAAAPGSKFKHLWINFHDTWDDAYIANALALMRSRKSGSWQYFGARSNERWNPGYPSYGRDLARGRDATDSLANNAGQFTQIASASGDGTTITVTAASPLPPSWTHTRNINAVLNGVSYRDVPATATGATSFAFPGVTPVGAISVAGCIFVGERLNPLNFDELNSLLPFANRFHARRTREIALLAEAAFGSLNGDFKMVLEHQRPTTTFNSGQNTMLEYLETQFSDRPVRSYLYALAHAPYAEPANQADELDTLYRAMVTDQAKELDNALYAKQVASSYGLKCLCYEGGPSTLTQRTPSAATVASLYADPRMRTLTAEHWKGIWARGFEHVAHMELAFQPARAIKNGFADSRYFPVDTSLAAALANTSQRSRGIQDLLAYAPGGQSIAPYSIPGTLAGIAVPTRNLTRMDYNGFSAPRFIWNRNLALDMIGGDFNALPAAEKAKPHFIKRGNVLCTATKDMTLALKIYLTGTGNLNLSVTIEDVAAGTRTDFSYPAAPNTAIAPLPFQRDIAVGHFIAGREYNITITVPAGTARNLSIGDWRFT